MVAFPLNIEIFTGGDKTDRPDQSVFQPVQPAGIGGFCRQPKTVSGRLECGVAEWRMDMMNVTCLPNGHVVSCNRFNNRFDIVVDLFKLDRGVCSVSVVAGRWHRAWLRVSDRRPQRSLYGKCCEVAIDGVENGGWIDIGTSIRMQPSGYLCDKQHVEGQVGNQPGPYPVNTL